MIGILLLDLKKKKKKKKKLKKKKKEKKMGSCGKKFLEGIRKFQFTDLKTILLVLDGVDYTVVICF